MTQQTSSAKKLYSILKQACDHDFKTPMIDVWTKVLGARSKDHNEVSDKLLQLFALFNDVKDDINTLENNEKYRRALNNIQTSILRQPPISTGEWKLVKTAIREEMLDLIDACGDLMISQGRGINEITPEQLEDLKQQINDLVKEIQDSEIDKDIKNFIINKLMRIKETIINYPIRGASGISKANEQALGGILLKCSQKYKKLTEPIEKVVNTLIKINGIIGVGERLSSFPEMIQKLLPGNNGG